MDKGIKMTPVGKVEMFSQDRQPKFESTNVTTKNILERVRSSFLILDDGRLELVDSLNSLPQEEKEALVRELTSCLSSYYYVQRANAICVLGLLGPESRSAIHAIVQAMNCWSGKVAMRAAEALPKIDASEAVTALASGLHEIPHPDATSLAWSTQDENIIHCLEMLGPSAIDAAPCLAAYLHLTGRTNQTLTSIGSAAIPAVLNEVRRATAKRLQHICRNAAEIFSAIGAEACQPLLDALESGEPDDRKRIALIFSFLEPQALSADAVPVLQRLLNDPSVSTSVRRALERLESGQPHADDAAAMVLAAVLGGRYIVSQSAPTIAVLNSMTEMQKEALAGKLIASVKSFRQTEQINALYVLGLLGPQARCAITAIVETFAQMNCRAVLESRDTLAKIGAVYAVPELIASLPQGAQRMLASGSSKMDEYALECLEVFGESLGKHASFLAAFVAKQGANTVLANIGTAVIPELLARVAQPVVQANLTWTCMGAADVLSSIGAAASQPLVDALEASSVETEEAISLVFSYLRSPALSLAAAPALSRLLLHESPGGKVKSNARKALIAVGALAAPAVFDALSGHLVSKRPGQTEAARILDDLLLKEFGAAAIPPLMARMADLDATAQASLASVILRIDAHNNDAAQQLLTLLHSDNAQVRTSAVRAIADARGQGQAVGQVKDILVPAVQAAWSDPDAFVRQAASAVLAQLLPHDRMNEMLASITISKSKREKEME